MNKQGKPKYLRGLYLVQPFIRMIVKRLFKTFVLDCCFCTSVYRRLSEPGLPFFLYKLKLFSNVDPVGTICLQLKRFRLATDNWYRYGQDIQVDQARQAWVFVNSTSCMLSTLLQITPGLKGLQPELRLITPDALCQIQSWVLVTSEESCRCSLSSITVAATSSIVDAQTYPTQ